MAACFHVARMWKVKWVAQVTADETAPYVKVRRGSVYVNLAKINLIKLSIEKSDKSLGANVKVSVSE